jgi:hypothetical protein
MAVDPGLVTPGFDGGKSLLYLGVDCRINGVMRRHRTHSFSILG